MWIIKVLKSFRYALEGLKYTVVTQRNMRIHVVLSICVLLLSLYLPLSKMEVLVLFICITLVLFAELMNTAMETIVDLVTEEYHPLAKIAKDVAAGAVLLTAGLAVIVGLSLFYPYLNLFVSGFQAKFKPSISLAAIIAADFFLTLMVKGWFHRLKKYHLEPSMTTSIAVCVSALISTMLGNVIGVILVLLLTVMLVASRYRMKPKPIPMSFGAVLGLLVAIVGLFSSL